MNAPAPSVAAEPHDAAVTLDDKYTLEKGRVYISGTQALVRLPMLQKARDRNAGLNTAGFISGYRGSPLGALDQSLWKAKQHLDRHHVIQRRAGAAVGNVRDEGAGHALVQLHQQVADAARAGGE